MRAGGMDRRTIRQASRRPITWRGRGGDSKAPLEPSRAATAQANARGERDRARKCARGAAEEVRDRPSSAWSAGVPKLPACERASADCLPRLVGGSSSRRPDDARSTKMASHQRRSSERSPSLAHDRRPSRLVVGCDLGVYQRYKRPTARRRGPRRLRRPGRQLEESCVANGTSVSKAARIGHPRPRLAARARRWPRARSLSARGGRWALDADGHRCEQAVPRARGPKSEGSYFNDLTGSSEPYP